MSKLTTTGRYIRMDECMELLKDIPSHSSLKDWEKIRKHKAEHIIEALDTMKSAADLIWRANARLGRTGGPLVYKEEARDVIYLQVKRLRKAIDILNWKKEAEDVDYPEVTEELLPIGRSSEEIKAFK